MVGKVDYANNSPKTTMGVCFFLPLLAIILLFLPHGGGGGGGGDVILKGKMVHLFGPKFHVQFSLTKMSF